MPAGARGGRYDRLGVRVVRGGGENLRHRTSLDLYLARENSHGSRLPSGSLLAPVELLLQFARGDVLIVRPLQGISFSLGLVVVVDDEAAGGEGVELLDHGVVVGVIQVRSQVVGGSQADEETVRVALGPPAEVLADGEVHDVGCCLLFRLLERGLDVLLLRVVIYRDNPDVSKSFSPVFCAL